MIFLYALHNHSGVACERKEKKARRPDDYRRRHRRGTAEILLIFPRPFSLRFSRSGREAATEREKDRGNRVATRRRNTKPTSFLASFVPENLIITPPRSERTYVPAVLTADTQRVVLDPNLDEKKKSLRKQCQIREGSPPRLTRFLPWLGHTTRRSRARSFENRI